MYQFERIHHFLPILFLLLIKLYCFAEIIQLEVVPFGGFLYTMADGMMKMSCVTNSTKAGNITFYKDGVFQANVLKRAGQMEVKYELPVSDKGGIKSVTCGLGNSTSYPITLHYITRPVMITSKTFLPLNNTVVVNCKFEMAPKANPQLAIEYYVNYTNVATITLIDIPGKNITERRLKFENTAQGLVASVSPLHGEYSIALTRVGDVYAEGTTYSCVLGTPDGGQLIGLRSEPIKLNQAGNGALLAKSDFFLLILNVTSCLVFSLNL